MTEVGSGITSSSDKNLETKFEKGASDRNAHPESRHASGGVSVGSMLLFVFLSSQWTEVSLKVVWREVNSRWSLIRYNEVILKKLLKKLAFLNSVSRYLLHGKML